MLAWLQQRNSLKGVCSHLSRMTPTEKNALSIRATHYPCCSETNTVLIQFCWLLNELVHYSLCNVPPGAAAGSASTSAPVRPPLLLFADSSSLPRSLLRVAIIRARIVTATSIYRSILPQGAPGWVS
ncbi:hypothetical protein T08_4108 [Trichinella sp. T8]|nr:hypothetical protein T08_4108 [Trichinella sp. T8]